MLSSIKLLAIDTATEQCSVAVLHGDSSFARCVPTPRGHADMVLPMVQEVMAEAGVSFTELDAIAFGRGPGSFTGVRIAIGVAQGLAFATGLPLLPISNLAAIAQQGGARVQVGERLLVCMDARMGEVYSGLFELGGDGLVVVVGDERLSAPEQIQVPVEGMALALGMGFRAYAPLRERYVRVAIVDDALPRAIEVAYLARRDWLAGLAVSPELATPVYLRDQVAHVKAL